MSTLAGMRGERFLLAISAVVLSLAVSSCAVIGAIFKAGAVTGIVAVVLFAAVVALVISRFSKSR